MKGMRAHFGSSQEAEEVDVGEGVGAGRVLDDALVDLLGLGHPLAGFEQIGVGQMQEQVRRQRIHRPLVDCLTLLLVRAMVRVPCIQQPTVSTRVWIGM